MSYKIAVLTATRAEYGLLQPIIKKMLQVPEISVKIVVTGAHLSPEFGETYKEIEKDGLTIDKKIEILLSSDTPTAVSKSMGLAMISFAEYFAESQPDALMILGDRYETLAVCCAAMNARIPMIHLYGGETTEGAIDEVVRHAITKMSHIHFTSTEEYKNRVIQMGEEPERVFCVGAMGVENALHISLLSKEELEQSLNFRLDKPYAVVTFHPVTLEKNTARQQAEELIQALSHFKDMKFIITKANADTEGRVINQLFEKFSIKCENAVLFDSLGMRRYLSALKYSSMVIGNSSSGLLEAPSFHIATVNIGSRQKGRLQGKTVINCDSNEKEIVEAIILGKTEAFQNKIKEEPNPYGDGNTSSKIVEILRSLIQKESIQVEKKFYDIKW